MPPCSMYLVVDTGFEAHDSKDSMFLPNSRWSFDCASWATLSDGPVHQ